MKDKRIIIIIAGIVLLGVIIFLIAWFSTRSNKNKIDMGDLKTVSKYGMANFNTIDNKTFYYLDASNLTFYSTNIEQTDPQELIQNDVYNIDDIKWSPDSTMAILKARNNIDSSAVYLINNFITKKAKVLDSSIIDANWDSNQNIVYLSRIKDEYKIGQSNNDGTGPKIIYNLGQNRCDTIMLSNIATSSFVCLSIQSDIAANLKYVNIQTGEIKQIDGDFTTAEANYQNTNIVALKNENNKSFWVVLDNTGKEISRSDINIDAIKITWSHDGKFLVVAQKDTKTETDIFYKIDVATGKKSKIKFSSGNLKIDSQNLLLSVDDKLLYFTSDDLLYSLKMK